MTRTPNARFERCVAEVLRHEGGFAQHPSDPGGATKYGITRATLSRWRGRDASVDDVRALTEAEAREIYLARYWNVLRCDELPLGVDLAVFDWGVNSGPARAARALQRLVGATVDGVIGRETIRAALRADSRATIDALCDDRLAWLRGLETWETFGVGWSRRVEAVRAAALAMARQGLPLAEAAQTDTVRASAAAVSAVAAAAAAVQEVLPAIEALVPLVERVGAVGLIVVAAALVVAGVVVWRRRRP
jgi:lysozyme family protein